MLMQHSDIRWQQHHNCACRLGQHKKSRGIVVTAHGLPVQDYPAPNETRADEQ